MAKQNVRVDEHHGTWCEVDNAIILGRKLFLMEHETYGNDAANIIIDEDNKLVMDGVWNGFLDYHEAIEDSITWTKA